jgi:hypothetical protein
MRGAGPAAAAGRRRPGQGAVRDAGGARAGGGGDRSVRPGDHGAPMGGEHSEGLPPWPVSVRASVRACSSAAVLWPGRGWVDWDVEARPGCPTIR